MAQKIGLLISDEILQGIPGYDPFRNSDPFYFDHQSAANAIQFIETCLTHVKGDLAGELFLLEDWQKAIIANLFGWKRKSDDTRRYRECFFFVPRKNGKSLLASAICNLVLFCDGEPGAEIYAAASEREQASLVWNASKQQILNEPTLGKHAKIYMKSIVIPETNSFFKPISADAKSAHGFNAQLVCIDELHALGSSDLVEVLMTSTGARKQPLIVHITTSDFERVSICNSKHDYASKVRDGIIEDPYFLPIIYEAKLEDDWTDPEIWKKANPNLGISISMEYMERECQRARDEPSYENTFKRLHLDIRTEQAVRWISMESWDDCAGTIHPRHLKGKSCFGGLDLSSTIDLSAFVLYFPGSHACLCWFWSPKENALEREKRDGVSYLTWERQGFMDLTPGAVIDYRHIRQKIKDLSNIYDIREIGYDRSNARQMCIAMAEEDELPMIEFRQGGESMNEPCKYLEGLLHARKIQHGDNPILRWMASNVTVRENHVGNIMIDKKKSSEKVDGMVSLVMGIGCAIVDLKPSGSIYETRGLVTL